MWRLLASATAGVYICDECALLTVFGSVMLMRGGRINLVFPDGTERGFPPFGDRFLGTEYCPHCRTYNVELGKPVGNECVKCGEVFSIRKVLPNPVDE